MSTEYAKIKYIFFHTKNLLIFKIPVLLRNILLLKSMTIYIIILKKLVNIVSPHDSSLRRQRGADSTPAGCTPPPLTPLLLQPF